MNSAAQQVLLGSGENDEALDVVCCANDACNRKCTYEGGSVVCQQCRLVAYHSKQCQLEHWKLHEVLCKSALMEESWGSTTTHCREASVHHMQEPNCNTQFRKLRLWDNVPAYGVLGDHVPAGQVLPQHLRLCFTEVMDLRNVIESMCQIPDDFNGRATFYVNTSDRHVAVRMFIMLELMRAFGEEAIDAVIALWYSVALTEKQSKAVNAVVSQVLRWESLAFKAWYLEGSEGPEGLGALFNSDTIGVFQQMIDCSTLTAERARRYWRYAVTGKLRLTDFGDERLSCLRPAHRLACHRFSQTGVLLPFASQEAHHNEANLLLFFLCTRLQFSREPAAYPFDPLQQWDIKQVLASGVRHGVPAMDLYGCLFFHLRSKLHTFLHKWRRCHVMIVLSHMTSDALACRLHERSLHRIDNSYPRVEYNMWSELRKWEPLLVTRRCPCPINDVQPPSSRRQRRRGGAAAASNEIEPLIITFCMYWPDLYQSIVSFEDPFSDVKTMLQHPAMTSEEAEHALERANHWALTRQGYAKMAKRLCNQCVSAYFHDYSKAFGEYLSKTCRFGVQMEPKEKNVALPHRLFVPIGADSTDTPSLHGNLHDFYICNVLHYGCTMRERFVEWPKAQRPPQWLHNAG